MVPRQPRRGSALLHDLPLHARLVVGHEHGRHGRPGQPGLLGRGPRQGGRARLAGLSGAAPQAARALLAGASVRAGTPLQAAKVPVGPRTRAPGQHDPPDAHPGQNLVPEPPLQDEAASQGQGVAAAHAPAGSGLRVRLPAAATAAAAAAAAAIAPQGGGSGSGQGRQAVSRERTDGGGPPAAASPAAAPARPRASSAPAAAAAASRQRDAHVRPAAGGQRRPLSGAVGRRGGAAVARLPSSGRTVSPQLARRRIRKCAAVLGALVRQDVVTKKCGTKREIFATTTH